MAESLEGSEGRVRQDLRRPCAVARCGVVLLMVLSGCRGATTSEPATTVSDQRSRAAPVAPVVASPGQPEALGAAVRPDAGPQSAGFSTKDVNRQSRFARRLAISDLEDIARPSGMTTALLGRRDRAAREELPGGVLVQTRCGTNWCVDGLSAGGRVLMPAEPGPEEARGLREAAAWLERVVRVTWQDESFVSAYVAQSEFSGGAHANNTFQCRTFDVKTGRPLGLGGVLQPQHAVLLLARARGLLEAAVALEELGEDLHASGFDLDGQGFRFDRTAEYKGNRPEIVLCAKGPYPSDSGTILELRLEAMPVGYLLR